MTEFYTADNIPTGVREITLRSVRAMQRSPHSSINYRLEEEQIKRELLLVKQTLSELDLLLFETTSFVTDGTMVDSNDEPFVWVDSELGTIVLDANEVAGLIGINNLVADLQNLARRVLALEQGR